MFYSLIERYSEYIADYEVKQFGRYGEARALVATIVFFDSSELYIKDYLFADATRKYSYHWQSSDGTLRSRWDNSPHHNQFSTYPHHVHTPHGVESSQAFTAADVLYFIVQRIGNNRESAE